MLGSDKLSPDQWASKRDDLLTELLHKMAIILDYDFDRTHIKNSSYAPRGHFDTEAQQEAIRKSVIEVLDGKRPLPMVVANLPTQH